MPKGSLLDYLMSRGRTIVTKKELVDFVMLIIKNILKLFVKKI
jgi:hypothetical protein